MYHNKNSSSHLISPHRKTQSSGRVIFNAQTGKYQVESFDASSKRTKSPIRVNVETQIDYTTIEDEVNSANILPQKKMKKPKHSKIKFH